MEVLLSIGESKKVLVVTEDTPFSVVEQELSMLGDVALLPPGFSSADLICIIMSADLVLVTSRPTHKGEGTRFSHRYCSPIISKIQHCVISAHWLLSTSLFCGTRR